MSIGGLSNKDGTHAEIDRGAPGVEGVIGGHDHAHDGPLAAELFEFEDEGRHHGFGGGCAESNKELLAEIAQQLKEVESGGPRYDAQNHNDKEDGDDPDLERKKRQRLEAAHAILADGV